MAKGDNEEHKMLFDIRGRRRNVVKVVYAILAILMGLSLFLLAGPVGFDSLFGSNNPSSEAAELQEERAERIERELRKDPDNPDLLAGLTRTRVNAGNSRSTVDPATGQAAITIEGRQQLEKASAAWTEYVEATDEPAAGVAQLMSLTLASLAETSRTGAEAEANIQAAAEAQEVVAEQRPSVGSLSTLARYQLFTFDYAGAKEANDEARKYANSKFEREQLDDQFKEVSKSAREFQKQQQELSKATQGTGKEGLENPLGGLGGASVSE